MNRFLVLAICTLAALSAANCHPLEGEEEPMAKALISSKDDEVTSVPDHLSVFKDFCVQSRDYVFAQIKEETTKASSAGYNWLFAMSEQVGSEVGEVTKDATARIGNQLRNPSSEVVGDDEIAQAQREISEQSTPAGLVTAFQSTLSAAKNAAIKVLKQKAEQARLFVSPENLRATANQGCDIAGKYEKHLLESFNEFKSSLTADYAKVKLSEVQCLTASRVSRVNGACGLIKSAPGPLRKLFGFEEN